MPADPLRSETEAALADRFTADIVAVEVPCGVVKVGAGYHSVSAFERRVFAAASAAHERTGAPVCVHTEHGTMGLELVELLRIHGRPRKLRDPRPPRPEPGPGRARGERRRRAPGYNWTGRDERSTGRTR